MITSNRTGALAVFLAIGFALHCSPPDRTEGRAVPGVADRLPWHADGLWLRGDTHVHNMLVPGGSEIVRSAMTAGLDFIATTEHAERAFGDEARRALEEQRREFESPLILLGIEWNIPSAGHASVIVERSEEEWSLLEDFVARFDRRADADGAVDPDSDETPVSGEFEQAVEALRWLARQHEQGRPRTAVYLNHLSRHDYLTHPQVAELQRAGLSGIEAAAGHQLRLHPGTPKSIDRYEPYVAVIGGGYDRLLDGWGYLGLAASSDFHRVETSYHPGVFSETLVYCPDRSPRGVVEGLAAGSSVTVLGRIVRAAETRASYDGYDDAAQIGETLIVPRGSRMTYSVSIDVPARDWSGGENRLDWLEIISSWSGTSAIVKTFKEIGLGRATLEYELPPEATAQPRRFFLRARGRRFVGARGNVQQNADLLFYTGGTRVKVN